MGLMDASLAAVPLAAAVAAVAGLLLGGPLQSLARRLARGKPAFPGWAGWDGARGRAATRAVTAVLLAATVLVHHGDAAQLVLGLLLVAVLVPLTLVDVAVRLLPDRLTGAAAVVAILAGTLLDPAGEAGRLVAGLAAGGAFLAVAVARPSDMGMGDVKLAAVLGLFLGADVAVAVFVALLAGVVAGLALMARKGVRAGRATAIAFGPFLGLGAVVAMLAGDGLLDAYVKAL
jgi:leader peptidase (prepilin peptidase)/N-methyltransferase